MRSVALAVMAAAAPVLAQVANYTSPLDMKIDPNSVDSSTRNTWCNAQYNTCRTLCQDNTNQNNCQVSDLTWQCTCASNNSMPGIIYYQQTIPSFICMDLFGQCEADNTQNSQVQGQCTTNIKNLCGNLPPPKRQDSNTAVTGQPSSTAQPSATAGSATQASAAVTTTTSKDVAAPTLMAGNGVAAVAAIGVLAYFL